MSESVSEGGRECVNLVRGRTDEVIMASYRGWPCNFLPATHPSRNLDI